VVQVKNRHVFPCRRQGLHIENVQTCLCLPIRSICGDCTNCTMKLRAC
jgi:hypothetical protein